MYKFAIVYLSVFSMRVNRLNSYIKRGSDSDNTRAMDG